MIEFDIHHFASLPSTQITAREWVEQGHAKPGDIIQADQQTAGYGRRGRDWSSPVGNLSFTLIEEMASDRLNWLGYAMGLALYDAVHDDLPDDAKLNLKWPNDLLLDSGKLSGMLLEVAGDHVLVGVGVNIATAPVSDQATAALNNAVRKLIQPMDLLHNIVAHYNVWRQAGVKLGFAGLREIWLDRAIWRDKTVTARLGNGNEITGEFVTLDDTGALVLNVNNVHHAVTSADIYLRS